MMNATSQTKPMFNPITTDNMANRLSVSLDARTPSNMTTAVNPTKTAPGANPGFSSGPRGGRGGGQ